MKNRFIPSLVAAVLTLSPVIAAPILPGTSVLSYQWTGLDVANTTEGPVTGEVGVFVVGADPTVTPPLASEATPTPVAIPASNSYTISSNLVSGLTPGNYELRVRLTDEAGNASAWSVAAPITIDVNPPASPTNLQVQ